MRVLGSKILLKRDDVEEMVNGIIIPNKDEKKASGLVVATGPGKLVNGEFIKVRLDVGERVYFGKYAGTDIEYSGEKYLVIDEEDVLCVMSNEG